MGESLVHDRLFCRHQHSGSVHGYSETRSRSNVRKEHTHTERHKYHKTHFLLHILGLFASYDPDWVILMMFPTGLFASYDPDDDSDDVCDLKRRVKCPSNF